MSDATQASDTQGRDDKQTLNLSFLSPSNVPDSLGLLGHYEIIEPIGRGGFGAVFKAHDPRLNRFVAIKIMALELTSLADYRQRFLREARSAAALKHPNIVLVYEVEERPIPYLVMELVEGQTLQQIYDEGRRFSVPEIIRVSQQIASALSAAHAQSLIHRDIKPSNIIVEAGEGLDVKITDFGLARTIDDNSLTRTGLVSGTPMYMSPEQTHGQTLDCRADLFSFGGVMYMLATGRTPYRDGTTLEVMQQVAKSTPAPIQSINPRIPDWLCDIIGKLQARDRDLRFQSASEVEAVLANWDDKKRLVKRIDAKTFVESQLFTTEVSNGRETLANTQAFMQPVTRSYDASPIWLIVYRTLILLVLLAILCLQLLAYFDRRSVGAKAIERSVPGLLTSNHDTLGAINANDHAPINNLSNGNDSNPNIGKYQKSDSGNDVALSRTVWMNWPEDAPAPARAPFDEKEAREYQVKWAGYLNIDVEWTNAQGIHFILIPPGEYMMGSTQERVDQKISNKQRSGQSPNEMTEALQYEAPQRRVIVPQPFYLSQCEVKQREYVQVVKPNPSRFARTNFFEFTAWLKDRDDHPVEKVSWNRAISFCNALSKVDGRIPAYVIDGDKTNVSLSGGYRLPTDAEWEFACRAGTTTSHWTGTDARRLTECEWIKDGEKMRTVNDGEPWLTRAVGLLKPNPFGLYDMAGNVSEWTETSWNPEDFRGSDASSEDKIAARNPITGDKRIIRGGAYLHFFERCRSACRSVQPTSHAADSLGVRLAISIIKN